MNPCHIVCVIIMGCCAVLSGCTATNVDIHAQGGPQYQKPGPPPHAPAHGYRHKNHEGHELEYNSKISVYAVVNLPETYFGNNLYIRMSSNGTWLVSTTLRGGWRPAAHGEVPYSLRSYYKKKKFQN